MGAKAGKTKVAVEWENGRGEVTPEQVAARAYEIHVSGAGGDEMHDWLEAERQLNLELDADQVLTAGRDAEREPDTAA